MGERELPVPQHQPAALVLLSVLNTLLLHKRRPRPTACSYRKAAAKAGTGPPRHIRLIKAKLNVDAEFAQCPPTGLTRGPGFGAEGLGWARCAVRLLRWAAWSNHQSPLFWGSPFVNDDSSGPSDDEVARVDVGGFKDVIKC